MSCSLERFTGILIEHYAGHLPLWLAPKQAAICTIVSDADDYARKVLAALLYPIVLTVLCFAILGAPRTSRQVVRQFRQHRSDPRGIENDHVFDALREIAPASAESLHRGVLGDSGLLRAVRLGRVLDQSLAAEIAKAESGGRQYAHSPTNDFGYWQINGVHGPRMATYNPIGNAKAAIAISSNGHNWRAWTTYVTGAYHGRC